MTASVIIIGHKSENRMDPAHIQAAAIIGRVLPQGPCSPNCDPTRKVLAVPDPSQLAKYSIVYDDSAEAKPAELYVLHFSDIAAADGWLKSIPGSKLAGKTVYLVDTTPPVAAAATGP
jgi:hypothetical protein